MRSCARPSITRPRRRSSVPRTERLRRRARANGVRSTWRRRPRARTRRSPSSWRRRRGSPGEPRRRARVRRVYRAADAAWRDGRSTRAEQLLEQAGEAVEDPKLRADLEHLRAKIELESHREASAYRRLLGEAERVEALDAEHASRLLTTAVAAAPLEDRPAVGRRAYELAPRNGGGTELH